MFTKKIKIFKLIVFRYYWTSVFKIKKEDVLPHIYVYIYIYTKLSRRLSDYIKYNSLKAGRMRLSLNEQKSVQKQVIQLHSDTRFNSADTRLLVWYCFYTTVQ